MAFSLAVFVVVGFAGILRALRLTVYAREAGRRGRACTTVMQDASMSDREKENALQKHARRLFVLLGILGGGSLLALGAPFGVVWLLDWMGLASFWDVMSTLERIDFLVGTVLVGGLGYALVQYLRQR